jgi:hypothetical protein
VRVARRHRYLVDPERLDVSEAFHILSPHALSPCARMRE